MSWLLSALLAMAVPATSWRAPDKPDPRAILDEAEADAQAGRYEDALAKHEWFHRESLRYQEALGGVRLSFALTAWETLGRTYAPALSALQRARDEALEQALHQDGGFQSFHDFASINRVLGEDARTRDAFVALEGDQPELARLVYMLAEPALVAAQLYELCGRYLQPKEDWPRAQETYRRNRRIEGEHGAPFKDFVDRSFTYKTALLIGLLVKNDRAAEAEPIAREARAMWNDHAFHQAIDAALQGTLPAPFP